MTILVNKLKILQIRKIHIINLIMIAIAISSLFTANKVYAVVGQSYNSMVSSYGEPKPLALNKAVSSKNLQRYQDNGVSVASYKFQVNGFKMITLFNSSKVCYEMKTYNNRSLPDPKDLIGNLVSIKPVVLNRVWLRSITLQYGTGPGAVIYKTSGLPGDLSAEAYSPSLKP
ncbi:MAG: hypothetical protein ACYCTB_03350 [bacterium]